MTDSEPKLLKHLENGDDIMIRFCKSPDNDGCFEIYLKSSGMNSSTGSRWITFNMYKTNEEFKKMIESCVWDIEFDVEKNIKKENRVEELLNIIDGLSL